MHAGMVFTAYENKPWCVLGAKIEKDETNRVDYENETNSSNTRQRGEEMLRSLWLCMGVCTWMCAFSVM